MRPVAAGHRRHAGLRRHLARRDLVAHQADRFGARPDEDQPGALDRLGEGGVLRQEAVAGMDGVGAGRSRRLEDRGDVQIGFRRLRRADLDRLVGELDGERFRVRLAVRLHRADAELARRADDAHGDLAAIGNEEFSDRHSAERLSRPARRAAGRPGPRPRSRRGTA